ncbi:lung adenoma susceptibility protein 2 [Larimichthys crocea]|uniref:lung adenoma susceptibility protein 2 n=1 Tax=Larimichthys crocea TaxID=215358 RepID=UPI000900FBCB|nr:lung adenoma susceptibility protein 2 [Larimichthys crocea]XP_027134446.1 lung adenoma susceptibility protein 2 [Larimichthys crocea]
MESSRLVGDCLSPESTVTSLLSSSGHLRSSLLAPELNSTFRYRDKNYDSASAALDAYIADYEGSHRNSKSLTGKLVLPLSPPSRLSRARVSTLRNKDVLRERLTDRELDFLNLPVSSLHHRSNRDRLSMTTDELLSIPHDGSMPVTHTSAFIQGFLSQSGASLPCPSSSRPAHRAWDRLSSSHPAPQLNHHHHPHPARTPRSSRCRGRPGAATVNTEDGISSVSCHQLVHRAARPEWTEPSASLHLPHWFTSNKTDMDCSGITSVPDLTYPAWIQHCDLSEPTPPTESELWEEHGLLPPATLKHGAPSWVAELEDDDPDQAPAQVDRQDTLGDLRLQFAEHISLLAAEKSSNMMETLYRDNRIESLIQKADQVLNSLSQSSGGPANPDGLTDCAEKAVCGLSVDSLCSSSHRHPVTLESAAAVGGVTEAQTDRGAQVLHGSSNFKQPGPVEALKQMFFRLQAVEAKLQRQTPAAPPLTDRLQTEETPVKPRTEAEAELESFPGGPSLQRALHHLSRLKVLVEEPRGKHREEEEKDEDEGRYSSSSADGPVCSQHKPS